MTSADPKRPPRAQDHPSAPPPGPLLNPGSGPPTVTVPPAPSPPVLAPQFAPLAVSSGQNTSAAQPQVAFPTVKAQRVPSKGQAAKTSRVAIVETETAPDLNETVLKNGPPFLISMFIHMLLVVVLALITFGRDLSNQVLLNVTNVDTKGLQLIDETLQSPASLEIKVDSPLLAFDLKPVEDPLAAPPNLSDFFLDANRATSTIEAPSIGLALTGREAGMKKTLLPLYGGNETTEAAVLAGLQWLKKNQMRDGGWSLVGPYPDGAFQENRCAATAMALLAFQGYGATHKPGATTPDFHDVVERGWNFLLKMQDKDGVFVHESTHNQRMYAQAQATIALCEIYGMTRDVRFKKPAQLSLDFAHKAQSPELGGWRYEPRIDSDTSVTGWYVMALQSGLMAGLEVQSPNLDMVNKFLDRVALEGGSKYAYQVGGEERLTMTAEALMCRQYLGWKHDDPRMRAGIDQLLSNRIEYSDDPNVYYWYYATQACHHMDGDDWNRWNERLREAVPAAQTKTGNDRGSWSSSSDRWGPHGGRLYVTCLSIYMLETYYRHLPIYKFRLKQ
jgi:hypothetical protein